MAKKINYWDNRFLKLDEEVFRDSEEYVKKIRKIYDREIDNLNKEIYNHLVKLQDEAGGISLADAKKLLNDSELDIFRSNLDEFTKKAQGLITSEIEKELNIVSRRVRISRLQAMEVEIKKSVASLMSKEEKGLFAHLGKTYEYKFYNELYELQRIMGYNSIQKVNTNVLKDIINSPWASDGSNFSKRIWGRGDKLVNLLETNLSRDIARGASPDESIKNIAKIMNTSKANAGRLVMTESAAMNSRATKDSYNAMGTEQYQILATLDTRTSEICRSLDDKVYDVKDYKIGITAPPFHPNCRTTTVPYFDDEIQRRLDGNRMARDPDTGKSKRIENLSYDEWHKKYVKSNPKAVAKERAWKNRYSDREQYDRYKSVLGENAPKTFEDFQKLKYNDNEKWDTINLNYRDETLKNAIKTKYNLAINEGRQGKHILGHNNYSKGKSYLLEGVNTQELVNLYAGTGDIRRDGSGRWINKQFFEHSEPIGTWVDIKTGDTIKTNRFSIVYSKEKGTHIVPARPRIGGSYD